MEPVPVAAEPVRLSEPEWTGRARRHEARVRAWTDPHQDRARRGERHPVWDFLFDYYPFRPSWLRRWHPGPDVLLEGVSAREYLRRPGYRELDGAVALDVAAMPESRRRFAAWLAGFLDQVAARPPFFGCHGLHEWAMVYRQEPEAVRHAAWPLRYPPDALARIVESSPIRCSHFDAFRFFTPSARPLNRLKPERETAPEHEQPGCLHANMDLYKWAFKLAPHAPSELIADAFELARDIRAVDMRASPYDLRPLGFDAIAIETAAGRAEYEACQRAFAERAAPLRARLRALCSRLLAEAPAAG